MPTTQDRPKGGIRLENERLILNAAEQIFSEEGFRGASVGMIADCAGVPKPNVYYYFGSKDDLYRRVLEDVCAAWLGSGDDFDDRGDPAGVIARYVGSKMDLARARPMGSRIWAMEMLRGAPQLRTYLADEVQPWLAAREATLTRWTAEGKLQCSDPRAFIFMIWATTQHYADFDAQITALAGGAALTDAAFAQKRAAVIAMVLASVGLPVPS